MTGTGPLDLYEEACQWLNQSRLLEETPGLRVLLEKLIRELPEESRPLDAAPEYRVDGRGNVLVVFKQSPGVRAVLGDLGAAASDAGDEHPVVRVSATAHGRLDDNTGEAVVTAWSGGKLAFRFGPGSTEGLLEAWRWLADARGGVPLGADRPLRHPASQFGQMHLWAPAELVAKLVELGVVEPALGVEPPEGAMTIVVDGPLPTFAVLVRGKTALEASVREVAARIRQRKGQHRSPPFRIERWGRGGEEQHRDPTADPSRL